MTRLVARPRVHDPSRSVLDACKRGPRHTLPVFRLGGLGGGRRPRVGLGHAAVPIGKVGALVPVGANGVASRRQPILRPSSSKGGLDG